MRKNECPVSGQKEAENCDGLDLLLNLVVYSAKRLFHLNIITVHAIELSIKEELHKSVIIHWAQRISINVRQLNKRNKGQRCNSTECSFPFLCLQTFRQENLNVLVSAVCMFRRKRGLKKNRDTTPSYQETGDQKETQAVDRASCFASASCPILAVLLIRSNLRLELGLRKRRTSGERNRLMLHRSKPFCRLKIRDSS